jgi:hypothetical protein
MNVNVVAACLALSVLLMCSTLLGLAASGLVSFPGIEQPASISLVVSKGAFDNETLTLTAFVSNGKSGLTLYFLNGPELLGSNVTNSLGIAEYSFLPSAGNYLFACSFFNVTNSQINCFGGEK